MSRHAWTRPIALLLGVASLLAPDLPAQFTEVTGGAGLTMTYMPVDPTGNDQADAQFGGASVADYDGDGWDDVYALGGWLGINKLFKNDGDGTFTNVALAAGVFDVMPGGMGLFGDVDNDGDLDLYVTTYEDYSFRGEPVQHRNALYLNDGDGTFTEGGTPWNVKTVGKWGAGFGDLDLDGDLDLVGSTWGSTFFPFGQSTTIYQNLGTTFIDSTPANVATDWTFAFAPRMVDYDADGDQDILQSGDFVTSRIYRNDGGFTFTNVSNAAGPLTGQNDMGSSITDIDYDGDVDWFISSTYLPDELLPQGWVPKTGNRLYLNDGDGTFTDGTDTYGVRIGGWGWGSDIGDLDNDGVEEIVHTNGFYVFGFPELWPHIQDDETRLFQTTRGLPMENVAPALGVNNIDQGRGMILFDYDKDGKLDILQSSFDNGLRLYRNEHAEVGNWLEVALVGGTSNARGVGSRVSVSDAARGGLPTQYRWITAGSNYVSQSPMVAWFGLDDVTLVDVTVEWPSGKVSTLQDVAVNQELVVTEPGDTWFDLGNALAGTGGLEPSLAGTGDLTDGSLNTLDLTDAKPLSTTYLFLGLAPLNAPFKGGTLVPAPIIPPLSLPTGPSGALSLPFVWPSGIPAGLSLYFQHWVQDAAGPKGFAASNGLQGITG